MSDQDEQIQQVKPIRRARHELADLLSAAALTVGEYPVKVMAEVPEAYEAPMLVVGPGSPPIEHGKVLARDIKVRWVLALLVPLQESAVATDLLDDFLFDTWQLFVGRYGIERVEQARPYRVGGPDGPLHLGIKITITKTITTN